MCPVWFCAKSSLPDGRADLKVVLSGLIDSGSGIVDGSESRSHDGRMKRGSGAQAAQQVLRMDRLGQNLELVALCTRLFQKIGRGGLAGVKQDLDLGQQRANLYGCVNAVQPAHDHVRDEHVGRESGNKLQGFLARVNCASLEAALV